MARCECKQRKCCTKYVVVNYPGYEYGEIGYCEDDPYIDGILISGCCHFDIDPQTKHLLKLQFEKIESWGDIWEHMTHKEKLTAIRSVVKDW